MNKFSFLGLAAVALIGVGGFFFHKYGEAKYEAGFNDARVMLAAIVQKSIDEARKTLEDANAETKSLDSDGLDIRAHQLGILRQPQEL